MKIQDRIRSFRRVPAKDLLPNPRNWRTHPTAQREALRGILAEVGFADACLARELPDGTLRLIDGHLRVEESPDAKIPTLILDLTDEDELKLLAVVDPLAAMAETDADALSALASELDFQSEALSTLVEGLLPAADTVSADGQGGDDSCDDSAGMTECPSCGHRFPK
jgi:ParB-like chromosome segregation protein Spo0J